MDWLSTLHIYFLVSSEATTHSCAAAGKGGHGVAIGSIDADVEQQDVDIVTED